MQLYLKPFDLAMKDEARIANSFEVFITFIPYHLVQMHLKVMKVFNLVKKKK